VKIERCPVCGWDVTMLPAFQAHLRQVAHDDAHVAALWTLLGIDYAQVRADERAEVLERARERGWEVF
jgi:hypothetical protein